MAWRARKHVSQDVVGLKRRGGLRCLTSCRLISLVEKVPFRWTSSVSDHRVLFLLLGGVGVAALLQGFWGTPGALPSPRKEACGRGGGG